MRMSDTVDAETMKVSEAADTVPPPKDANVKPEGSEQSQTNRDEHSSDDKRDTQVKSTALQTVDGCLE